MGVFDQMAKSARLHKEADLKKEQAWEDFSKRRQEGNVEKKVRTAFIGALDSFEREFGELWGHGTRDTRELTEEQVFFRRKWERCRKDVLDKGNTELRAIKAEIAEYTIKWNRYHKNLPVGGNYGY